MTRRISRHDDADAVQTSGAGGPGCAFPSGKLAFPMKFPDQRRSRPFLSKKAKLARAKSAQSSDNADHVVNSCPHCGGMHLYSMNEGHLKVWDEHAMHDAGRVAGAERTNLDMETAMPAGARGPVRALPGPEVNATCRRAWTRSRTSPRAHNRA